METENKTFIADESQQKVIEANNGYHLVLAPPGCGKTQILTERIRRAHADGVGYADMLCLTFTNRAARGMVERIQQNIDDKDVTDVFVGNIHRYCIRMLTTEELVPSNSAIIDDDDALSIISRFTGDDEDRLAADYKRRTECFNAIHLSHMMHQIEKGYPKEIRLHTEALSKEDVGAMMQICKTHNMQFTPETMLDIYHNAEDFYTDSLKFDQTAVADKNVLAVLQKLSNAYKFEKYKKDNMLMDFNDILLYSYDALKEALESEDDEKKEFLGRVQKSWVQLDEVQDLSPLQMAIVDMICKSGEKGCIMYLGDEQQSIFSFMGTKMSTMNNLKERCAGHIHHLSKNHRSPKYLLDACNTYATKVLGISPDILPQPVNKDESEGRLRMETSETADMEYHDVAKKAKELLSASESETTAIIVPYNNDAEAVSQELDVLGVPHFKISGTDMFSSAEMKLLLAHFSVIMRDCDKLSWARIIQKMGGMSSAYGAREMVRCLMDAGIAPCELMLRQGTDTYTQDFARTYETLDIVIFDTETTGLDVYDDDIIQIAAMRIRGGEVMGKFNAYVETGREIPEMLGTIVNPIIEERKTADILTHKDALLSFAEFADGAVLLAHNSDFDIHILEHNVRRYAPELYEGGEAMPKCFDSLRMIRLLEPGLRVHKLKVLLQVLGLEGQNSHLADDDVYATKSLVDYCYRKATEIKAKQEELLGKETVKRLRQKLMQNYEPLYRHSVNIMWNKAPGSTIVSELRYVHDSLVKDNIIHTVDKLNYAIDYISHDLIDSSAYPTIASQMMRYGAELGTLKEADLCDSNRIHERVYVTTVHKAKGLEFDNVIVYDVVEGRYPGFNSKTQAAIAEDARKLYVAISRSRKRLFVYTSLKFVSRYGSVYEHKASPFLEPIMPMFA